MKRMLQPNLIRIISMNLIAILQQHEGILRLEKHYIPNRSHLINDYHLTFIYETEGAAGFARTHLSMQ